MGHPILSKNGRVGLRNPHVRLCEKMAESDVRLCQKIEESDVRNLDVRLCQKMAESDVRLCQKVDAVLYALGGPKIILLRII